MLLKKSSVTLYFLMHLKSFDKVKPFSHEVHLELESQSEQKGILQFVQVDESLL